MKFDLETGGSDAGGSAPLVPDSDSGTLAGVLILFELEMSHVFLQRTIVSGLFGLFCIRKLRSKPTRWK